MKYTEIKKISGKLLVENDYNNSIVNEWCKKHGFYIEIKWTEEVENWCTENNLTDDFVSNNFIKEKEHIDPENYIYCFKTIFGNIFKLTKISDSISQKYAWCCVNKTLNIWSDLYDTVEEAFEDLISSNVIVKQFNSMREVVEEYDL